MRILEGLKRDRFVRALERRGANDLAKVEPAVRRIVNNVRSNGDRALRRYAARWDGLGRSEPVRVPEADLHEAWRRTSPGTAGRDHGGRKQHSPLLRVADAGGMAA